MAWYNPFSWREKLNPAQGRIAESEGTNITTDAKVDYYTAFNQLESVNRGINMIVAACSSLDYDIKEKIISNPKVDGIRKVSLEKLLNVRPNPFQSAVDFRRALFLDFLLEGNAFIYYDGTFLYHLPAAKVEINPDPKTFVQSYKYMSTETFSPYEVAHFKDLSMSSIYRGTSRLSAADNSIKTMRRMLKFQDSFFENGAIPGMALATDNTMSQQAKDKTVNNWTTNYSVTKGARKPIIIDSGLKPVPLFTTSFKELDFDVSIKSHNVKILESLGVPPVLLDGGNQANISPNLRLFYLETVLPIVRAYISAMELLTGYDIEAITATVSALQPEIKDIAMFNTTLVNGGVITPNEARENLRYPKDTDPESDKLRIPANIAGSAADASQGGAPKKEPPK